MCSYSVSPYALSEYSRFIFFEVKTRSFSQVQQTNMAASKDLNQKYPRFHREISTDDLVTWLREGGLGHKDCEIIRGTGLLAARYVSCLNFRKCRKWFHWRVISYIKGYSSEGTGCEDGWSDHDYKVTKSGELSCII